MNESPYTEQDKPRLDRQRASIRDLMLKDGDFKTLKQIEDLTGYPQASISAQLRHLRKKQYGGYTVNKIHILPDRGTWYYQVLETGLLFSTKS